MIKDIIFDANDNHTLQNFKMLDNKIWKIPGTNRANSDEVLGKTKWATRYYGLKADGSFVKKAFCSIEDKIYMLDEVNDTLTAVKTGLNKTGNPESLVMQVSGNSREYFFNGYDTPIYYEGDENGTWYDSAIEYKFVQCVEKDQRMWGFERNTSRIYFSRVLRPEDFDVTYGGSLTFGNEKDSFIRRIMTLNDYVYVFKNDSIWRILGNSQATYQPQLVVAHRGLLAQKAANYSKNGITFICQQDKEPYSFNGSAIEEITYPKNRFAPKLDLTKTDDICCIEDTRNKLFRISYNNRKDDETYNNHEFCYTTEETNEGGIKWFDTHGAKISCYSMWDRQGDNDLVTGRADIGALMYHNRGYNWDTDPMECIVRGYRFIPKAGYNTQFEAVFIKGKPSSGTITLKVYLNERTRIDSTFSSQNISDVGEQEGIEDLNFSVQEEFNNYIPLLTGYNYGECVSFEIYDRTLDKEIMIDYLIVHYTTRSKVLNNLVG